jgi:tetratricopeptide (TPR) repeat protein
MKYKYQECYTRAFTLRDNEDYDGAIAEFSAVLDDDPDETYALEWRGDSYHRKGDNKKALADYSPRKALRRLPRSGRRPREYAVAREGRGSRRGIALKLSARGVFDV